MDLTFGSTTDCLTPTEPVTPRIRLTGIIADVSSLALPAVVLILFAPGEADDVGVSQIVRQDEAGVRGPNILGS